MAEPALDGTKRPSETVEKKVSTSTVEEGTPGIELKGDEVVSLKGGATNDLGGEAAEGDTVHIDEEGQGATVASGEIANAA